MLEQTCGEIEVCTDFLHSPVWVIMRSGHTQPLTAPSLSLIKRWLCNLICLQAPHLPSLLHSLSPGFPPATYTTICTLQLQHVAKLSYMPSAGGEKTS